MNEFFKQLASWIFRLSLLAAGLIFLLGLLFADLVLLVMWLLRALWARLTGQPVQPWVFRMHQSDLWQRAYRPAAPGARGRASAGVIDAEAKVITDVTDVEEKRR